MMKALLEMQADEHRKKKELADLLRAGISKTRTIVFSMGALSSQVEQEERHRRAAMHYLRCEKEAKNQINRLAR